MKKRRKILFFSCLLFSLGIMAQSHITIVPLSGMEQQALIEKIGKITFSNNVMYLHDDQGTQLGYTSVENIDKILFSDEEINSIEGISSPSIQVFPNPAQESIFIKGVEKGQNVRIYSLQGQPIASIKITSDESQLHIGGLQNGTYLLQVGAQIVKLIKQ